VAPFEADLLPKSVDVVIAGAGIGGLSAAIEFAKRGRSVALVDSHKVGYGASSRNMGFLSGVAKEAEAFLLQLLTEAGADCDLQSGAMLLAPGARNLRDLAASIPRRKQEYGMADYVIGREQLHQHIGGCADQEFAGALIMPDARYLHPGKMIVALASYAQALGVQVCENSPITGWRRDGGGVSVYCDDRRLAAGSLLLTTGGYGKKLSLPLWRRNLSVPSTAAVSEELPDDVINEAFPESGFVLVNRFRGYNCRLSPDRKRVMLAGPIAVAPRGTETDLRAVRDYFERLFPSLAGIDYTHCWTGYAAATRDRRVHTGSQDGAWYSIGSSGLVHSAVAGRRAADLVLNGGLPDDNDFPVWPLRRHRKLLWAGIALAARTLDRTGRSRQR